MSTASLAFSGSGPIAAGTRDRVLESARELGYAGPNPLGRQLRSGRSGIVGVFLGDVLRRIFREPVAVQTLDGLVATLAPLGLGVLLLPAGSACKGDRSVDDAGAPTQRTPGGTSLAPDLSSTAAMDVAVLLWGANPYDEVVQNLGRRGIPFVNVEGPSGQDAPLVTIDDRGGTAAMGRHLRALGHERIALVTMSFGPDVRAGYADAERTGPGLDNYTRRRLAGAHDAGIDPIAVFETPASLVEHGTTAGRALLALEPRPTAIMCQSDLLAAGVMLAARELGVRVPEDVSISGFDGIELAWLAPDVLTTVSQPFTEKGAAIARHIEAIIAGKRLPDTILDVELRVGTTTGPPPAE